MSTNRLSLSSSVFSDRIKKFDTYNHNPKKSQRPVARQASQKSRIYKKQQTTPPRPTTKSTRQLALQAVSKTQDFQNSSDAVGGQFSNFQYQTPKTKRTKLQSTMYVMAAFVFLFASAASVQTLVVNRQNKQQIEEVLGESSAVTSIDSQGVTQGTGNNPAEKEVSASAIGNYQVSNPEHPRYLRVPALGIESRIKPLGEKDGAVDAPWNINDVGWYDGSTRPGNTRGSSLLLGHVSGWTAPGVFKHLDRLQAGERFEVEKGSGEKVQYQVVRSESIPLDQIDMSKILAEENYNEHDLKLMTCSGKYNRDTETYEERMVVYAKILRG